MRVAILYLMVIGLLTGQIHAQNKPGLELEIRKTSTAIKLDGVLDELSWTSAQVASGFFMNFPYDTALAPFQTEARLTFDEHNLYVSFVLLTTGK